MMAGSSSLPWTWVRILLVEELIDGVFWLLPIWYNALYFSVSVEEYLCKVRAWLMSFVRNEEWPCEYSSVVT